MIYIIIALVWVVTSILSYGICLDWHKRKYPYFAYGFEWWALDLLGPVGLIATLIGHKGKYGLQWRDFTRDERYKNFCKMYGTKFMTREEFDKEY
jgi:hypothetical protein